MTTNSFKKFCTVGLMLATLLSTPAINAADEICLDNFEIESTALWRQLSSAYQSLAITLTNPSVTNKTDIQSGINFSVAQIARQIASSLTGQFVPPENIIKAINVWVIAGEKYMLLPSIAGHYDWEQTGLIMIDVLVPYINTVRNTNGFSNLSLAQIFDLKVLVTQITTSSADQAVSYYGTTFINFKDGFNYGLTAGEYAAKLGATIALFAQGQSLPN